MTKTSFLTRLFLLALCARTSWSIDGTEDSPSPAGAVYEEEEDEEVDHDQDEESPFLIVRSFVSVEGRSLVTLVNLFFSPTYAMLSFMCLFRFSMAVLREVACTCLNLCATTTTTLSYANAAVRHEPIGPFRPLWVPRRPFWPIT